MIFRVRKNNRLKGYNYSNENLYFVTICVQDRISCFGEVDECGIMILNDYGEIANNQWKWLEKQYPYLVLHAFVVMPNHIHGVLEINCNFIRTGRDLSQQSNSDSAVRTGRDLSQQSNSDSAVRTGRDLSLPKIKSLSELIGAYKTTTSKQIHLLGYNNFRWQRSFHDHIIKNDISYHNIINYINENPMKWENDKYFMRIKQKNE